MNPSLSPADSGVTTTAPVESRELSEIVDIERRLITEFGPTVPAHMIVAAIADAFAGFEGAPIRTFIPLLVERKARDQLRSEVVRVEWPRTLSTDHA